MKTRLEVNNGGIQELCDREKHFSLAHVFLSAPSLRGFPQGAFCLASAELLSLSWAVSRSGTQVKAPSMREEACGLREADQ